MTRREGPSSRLLRKPPRRARLSAWPAKDPVELGRIIYTPLTWTLGWLGRIVIQVPTPLHRTPEVPLSLGNVAQRRIGCPAVIDEQTGWRPWR